MEPKPETYVRKDGSVAYRIKITVNGRRVQSPVFDSREELSFWVARIRVAQSTYGEDFDLDKPKTPLRAYADLWLSERTGRASTRYKDKAALKLILDEFGDRPIASISRHDIQMWVNKLSVDFKRSTVESYYGTLSQILKMAAADHYLPAGSPIGKNVIKLEKRKASEQSWMVLDYDEFERLLETTASQFPEDYPFVLTIAETGCRIAEAAGLRREDYDPEAGTLTFENALIKDGPFVESGDTKTGEKRAIYVTERLAEALDKHLASHDSYLIFPQSNGRPLQLDNWRKRRWSRIKKAAGIPSQFRVHDLRHTMGSHLLDAGVPDPAVAKVLGHRNTRMIRSRYGHALDESLREAMSRREKRSNEVRAKRT